MPTYSYKCTECGNAFDIQQSFTDDSLSTITDSSNKTDDVGTVDLSQSPPVYTES